MIYIISVTVGIADRYRSIASSTKPAAKTSMSRYSGVRQAIVDGGCTTALFTG